ncbi:unnamed protein product [Orchesella dallaii]|uniref:Uncharacterized protein n=1 Tax=Orchesella dallaii TaxID=48710 RepID=A0ABP1R1J5_9HEXA
MKVNSPTTPNHKFTTKSNATSAALSTVIPAIVPTKDSTLSTIATAEGGLASTTIAFSPEAIEAEVRLC